MGNVKTAFCTCDNLETAKKLAACVNILPNIHPVYTWNNKVEQSEEILMILKTPESLVEKLRQAVVMDHLYDVPEFICLDITSGHQPYLDWLTTSTQKAPA